MADAIISRRGGGKAKLKSICIANPPNKTSYIAGGIFSVVGMVVYANIGGAEIEVYDYTCTPTIISADTQSVTISYTFDGVTKTAMQPVSVITPDSTLDNNEWALIAEVAASGTASNVWSIGDTKSITLNGVSCKMQIIGFNHDDLNSGDSRYNDSDYNGGSKKAGITFRLSNKLTETYKMHNSAMLASLCWRDTSMRLEVMPKIKGYLPAELQSALRTVDKITADKNGSSLIATPDEVFILSLMETTGSRSAGSYSTPAGEGTQYAFFAAGNSYHDTFDRWTRSIINPYYCAMLEGDSTITRTQVTTLAYINPAFCL